MLPHIEFFGREIGLYPLMALCGLFSAGIYASVMANKCKYNYVDIIIFILFISIGVVIGSHLLYTAINHKNIVYVFENIKKINTFDKIINVLKFTLGGSIFYGGLIGGIIACYILIKKDSKNKLYVDIMAVNIPLFHFFGRIGCFFGGCCYGIHCKIGFIYTNSPIVEANGIIRFPVQLFEAFFNLFLFLLLNYFLNRGSLKNNLIYVYLIIYSAGRFFIEFLRGDEYRGFFLKLSTSQIISIIIFFLVIPKIYGLFIDRIQVVNSKR